MMQVWRLAGTHVSEQLNTYLAAFDEANNLACKMAGRKNMLQVFFEACKEKLDSCYTHALEIATNLSCELPGISHTG